MLPLRFCFVGVGLIVLAFGFFWAIWPTPPPRPFYAYDVTAVTFAAYIFYSLIGAGLFCIVRGGWLALAGDVRARRLPRIFPELPLRNVTAWNRRDSSKSLIPAMLNAFSVSWICVLMNLLIVFQVLRPRPPFGISIEWKERSHIAATESPWPETMSVYIGDRCEFYVNGKAIKEKNLDAVLKSELARRAEWTVYVEADPNSMFMCTASALDAIQGVGGRAVWITPKMRAEWKKENGATPTLIDRRTGDVEVPRKKKVE